MGDCRIYSTEESCKDLWLQEDISLTPLIEEFHINLRQDFDFFPNLEQGFSLLEEISRSEDNGLSKQNTSIAHQQSRETNFSSVSNDPNSNWFVEKESEQYVYCINNTYIPRVDPDMVHEQVKANPSTEKRSLKKGFHSKTEETKSNHTNFGTEKKRVESDRAVEEDSVAKKQNHNAKERLRRMKLHASYLALGSLLPISRISKKRWTAPVIIDKVLDYIPVLESEIEQLTQKKNSIVSSIDENKQLLLAAEKRMNSKSPEDLTISVNQVRGGELILQICKKRDDETSDVFSKLLQKLEDESVRIVSSSTFRVCEERECYNIHVQVNESSSFSNGSDYITALKQQLISWLS